MEKKMKKILICIHEELHSDFKQVCEKEYKTVSEMIRHLMLHYIKEYKDAKGKKVNNK